VVVMENQVLKFFSHEILLLPTLLFPFTFPCSVHCKKLYLFLFRMMWPRSLSFLVLIVLKISFYFDIILRISALVTCCAMISVKPHLKCFNLFSVHDFVDVEIDKLIPLAFYMYFIKYFIHLFYSASLRKRKTLMKIIRRSITPSRSARVRCEKLLFFRSRLPFLTLLVREDLNFS
jgi:hypothetical protein